MRPTNLGFRNPKERTAEYRNPSVTFDGRLLPLIQLNNHTSIPKSKRFTQYDYLAKRIGTTVGPGSYNLRADPLTQWNISGTPVIKPYHAISDPSKNGYLLVGDAMIYDEYADKKHTTRRASQGALESSIGKTARISTSSTPRRIVIKNQDSLEKMKNSPYLAHRLKNNSITA